MNGDSFKAQKQSGSTHSCNVHVKKKKIPFPDLDQVLGNNPVAKQKKQVILMLDIEAGTSTGKIKMVRNS